MGDLIDRKAAIDALAEVCVGYDANGQYDEGTGAGRAKEVIEGLPSAEPKESLDKIVTRHEEIGYDKGFRDGYAQAVTDAEPVRCKDCKHNPKDEWFGCPMSHLSEAQRPETAWCWKAERRTDE